MNLFLFRRDLRLFDNITLHEMLHTSEPYILAFIFTPEQVDDNKYKSNSAIQFMCESIQELSERINELGGKLNIYYGTNEDVIKSMIKNHNISKVWFNRDNTPYSRKRDKSIENLGVPIATYENYTIVSVDAVKTDDGKYYTSFTPYYNKAKTMVPSTFKLLPEPKVLKSKIATIKYSKDISFMQTLYTEQKQLTQKGSRTVGLKSLKTFEKSKYAILRDEVSKNTSMLSAHIKFGTISIREVYNKINIEIFRRQLFWNSFYAQLFIHLPKKQTIGGGNFKNKTVKWKINNKWISKWKNGTTGFPFIDAGMRQLKETGFMHNRARMATANFFSMIMHQNWKIGERHFANNLVDYDPAQNNGNWQWSVGLGIDRTGYLRIFNPWAQSQKHDKHCKYIQRWIPELRDIPIKDIHNWESKYAGYKNVYHEPMLNYKEQRKLTYKMY